MAEFFLELVSEEIPPSQQTPAADNLAGLLAKWFKANGADKAQLVESFSTPLRFGVVFDGVQVVSPARTEERRGPPENAPDKAIEGFRRSVGDSEITLRDGYHFALLQTPEVATGARLAQDLPALLENFPWAKSMRWLPDNPFRWTRPLVEITCALDGKVVPFEVAGVSSSVKKEKTFAAYKKTMADKGILLDPQAREEKLKAQIEAIIKTLDEPLFPLFDTSTIIKQMAQLCEQPKLILQQANSEDTHRLSDLMAISEMQKSFFYKELAIPYTKADGEWAGHFFALIHENDQAEANAKKGFQKTLNARLADALFFIEEDGKKGMETLREELAAFTFHPKLGSMLDKAKRIEQLCAGEGEATRLAARFCKADIASLTGKEFPEATGGIGAHLLRLEQFATITETAAAAIESHYRPKTATDDLPSDEGQQIALADRADTLVGFFSQGIIPSGSKDPYALRRAAIGMIRIILESEHKDFIALNLNELFARALDLYGESQNSKEVLLALRRFMAERLKHYLRADYPPDLVEAAMKDEGLNLNLIHARLKSLHAFLQSGNGKSLMAAWKRISGILPKQGTLPPLDPQALSEPAEIALAAQLQNPTYAAALAAHNFDQAFDALAAARPLFDDFFEQVRVDDKPHRLALCAAARDWMLLAADFSKIRS